MIFCYRSLNWSRQRPMPRSGALLKWTPKHVKVALEPSNGQRAKEFWGAHKKYGHWKCFWWDLRCKWGPCYWKLKKGGPCNTVAENLTDLSASVLWKVELVSNETGYLAKEISKQVLKVWLGSSQTLVLKWEKREMIWRKKLLSKNEPELWDLENSQPLHIAKQQQQIGSFFRREY